MRMVSTCLSFYDKEEDNWRIAAGLGRLLGWPGKFLFSHLLFIIFVLFPFLCNAFFNKFKTAQKLLKIVSLDPFQAYTIFFRNFELMSCVVAVVRTA